MPSMVGSWVARWLGKSVMFFYLFATLLNDEVCNNGNAMKQCNFQNNYGVIAYRKICSCSSIFKFSYRPPEFSLRGKFIPKITIFGDLRGCKPTFFKAKTVKFGIRVRTWDSHPMQNFVKNHLRGYTPLGKFIQKNTNFGDFGAQSSYRYF